MSERWAHIEDPGDRYGHTQVSNFVLMQDGKSLSYGAKIAFMVLKAFAWNSPTSYPGQTRLMQISGMSEDKWRKSVKELEDVHLIHVKKRGQGRTNLYTFPLVIESTLPEPIPFKAPDQAHGTSSPETLKTGFLNTPDSVDLVAKNNGAEEYEVKEDKVKKVLPTGGPSGPTDPTERTKPKSPIKEFQQQAVAELHERLKRRGLLKKRALTQSYKTQLVGEIATNLNKGIPEAKVWGALDQIVARWEHVALPLWQAMNDLDDAPRAKTNGRPHLSKAHPTNEDMSGWNDVGRRG